MNFMEKETILQQIKEDLYSLKENELTDLYGFGPLGAKPVDIGEIGWFENRCTSTYRICRNPKDIDRNLKVLEYLLNTYESQTEYDVLLKLHNIYSNYIRIERNSVSGNIHRELMQINYIINEMKRLNTFKDNQNIFDNEISVIKIIERFNNSFGVKLNYKPIFNIETFDIDKIQNDFYELNRNKFVNIRLSMM